MNVPEIVSRLEAMGSEQIRNMNHRNGAGDNHFGVKMGDIRALAKEIKVNHDLGLQLWATGNIDAQFLSLLLLKPKQVSAEKVEEMVASVSFANLLDWLGTNLVKLHPQKEELRLKWLKSDHPSLARMGWSLTAERIVKSPDGLDFDSILDRVEKELAGAHELPKWTMNFCLGEIGIASEKHRARVLEIGEKIGAYSDYPASKGCIPPYVPVWVSEMVKRK